MNPDLKETKSCVKRRRKFIGCSPVEHFEVGETVGVGTFGEVVKAKHTGSSKQVALKKIFMRSEQEGFPITSLREIKLLKLVKHPNVVNLVDMAATIKPSTSSSEPATVDDIYMVFPFMDHDLVGLMENSEVKLSVPVIKCYFKQVLLGLEYLHQKNIMHRDMKGANLLLNNRGEVQITDFGLARPLEENRLKYTPGVITRWYRPPELLLGSTHYNQSVDLWGAGCILSEMYLNKPLFRGASDLEQLESVCRLCGTPSEDNLPGVSSFPDFSKIKLQNFKRNLREYLFSKQRGIDSQAADLIDSLLTLDPKRRPSASEALKHPYFVTEPLPCKPSEVPTFESSHEYTVQKSAPDRPHMTPRSHGDFKSYPDPMDPNSSFLPPPPPPPSRPSSGRTSLSPRRRHHESDRRREVERYHPGSLHRDSHHEHHSHRHSHRSRSPPTREERHIYRDLDSRGSAREVSIDRNESRPSNSSVPETPRPPKGRKQISYDDIF